MTDHQFGEYERLSAQEAAANIAEFFKHMGVPPAKCKDCDAPVFWVRHKTGAKAPYDAGTLKNHLKTCVKGEQYARDQFNNRHREVAINYAKS